MMNLPMPGRKNEGIYIFIEIIRLVYEIDIIVSNCEKLTTHVDDSLQIFQIRDFFLEAGYNVDFTKVKWSICKGRYRESTKEDNTRNPDVEAAGCASSSGHIIDSACLQVP
jgi:hypothetical protein